MGIRPSELDRAVMEGLEDGIRAVGLDPDDIKDEDWTKLQDVLREVFTESGLAIRGILIDRLPALTVAIDGDRRLFESRLRREWGPALEGLDGLINASMEAGELYIEQGRAARLWTATDEALVRIHSRSCMVAGEVLALLRAGFPSGANARWRTLHELAATAFFIKDRGDDLADRYLEHRGVAMKREFDAYARSAGELGEREPTPGERQQIDEPVKRLKARFGSAYGNRYGCASHELGIADPSFDKIEDAIEMGSTRHLWKQASESVHSGPRSFYDDLGAQASRGAILLAGASNTGLGGPGRRAASSLTQSTVALLNRHVTAERLLLMRAMIEFSAYVGESFDACDDAVEAASARSWGRIIRRVHFAGRHQHKPQSFLELKRRIVKRRSG